MTALVPQVEFFVFLDKQTPFSLVFWGNERPPVHVEAPLFVNSCFRLLEVDAQSATSEKFFLSKKSKIISLESDFH